MKLSKDELNRVARLARLKIEPKEEEKLRKDLSSILDYVSQIQELKLEQVEPTYQVTSLVDNLREDKVKKFEDNKSLLDSAPEVKERLVKVKKVFND